MNPEDIESQAPDFLALKQDMEKAFTHVQEYVLTPLEVEAVYLCICRLQALEEMAAAGNWDGVKMYLPHPEEDEQSS